MKSNAQEALDFGPTWGVDQAFSESMLAVRDGYQAIGNLVAAGATGIDKADLPKMFEPGSGRHLRYKAVFAIGKLASIEVRRRALVPLAELWGLGICDPRPMPPEEKAARLEAALNALGPIGQAARIAALGGKP